MIRLRSGDRLSRRRLLQFWAVGIAASLLVTTVSALGYLEFLQVRGLELLLRLRGASYPSDVVIVAIDDAAFAALGRRQPISRAYLARVIRGLQRSGAAVVGVDVTLASATDVEEDRALAEAISAFADATGSRVVLAEPATPPSGPLADPALHYRVLRGSPTFPKDDDDAVRRIALVIPGRATVQPSFALAVGVRLAGLDASGLATLVALRPVAVIPVPVIHPRRTIRVGPRELWPVNFVGPGGKSFLTIPADTMAAFADPGVEIETTDNPLRGRVALIGGTFAESQDFVRTPYGRMAGVEVHANAVHMLITGKLVEPAGWGVALGVQVGVALTAALVFVVLRPIVATIVCVVGALALGVPASLLAFDRGGYWVDFVLPVLATCLMGLGSDVLARLRFRNTFGRYVSREVMAKILRDGHDLAPERREVSILFSDLRGFTTLSESMRAEALAAHLNEYFEAMTAAIFARRGLINNFIGDGVMAVFAAPVEDPDHAVHAVEAALDMEAALRRLNRRWQAQGLPALRMGIGINTGSVFAGNVGGGAQIKYTMIGDPVNVAARVESLNKELGSTVLVTEETRRLLGTRFDLKDRGSVHVKGREQRVHVYEVVLAHGENGDG
jgi:class 3 adenylate cyclase